MPFPHFRALAQRLRLSGSVSVSILIALATPSILPAQSTWIGETSVYGIGSNWSTNTAPGTGTAVVFDGRGVSDLTTTGSYLYSSMTFTGGSYTFTGGTTKYATGTGRIEVQAGTQTFNGVTRSHQSTVTYTVASGAAMVSTGSYTLTGTITLSGAGTHEFGGTLNQSTGSITLDSGTVLFNGTTSTVANLITANGGTLGGIGTINRNTILNSTAFLNAGVAGAGVLTFGQNLTLNSGSTTQFDFINGATRGIDYDGVNVTGLTTYGGTLVLDFSSTLTSETVFDLFNLTGGTAGSFAAVTATGKYSGDFTYDGAFWTATSGGSLLTFDQSTGDLTVTPVPEPAATAVLTGGLMLWFVLGRRQRASV